MADILTEQPMTMAQAIKVFLTGLGGVLEIWPAPQQARAMESNKEPSWETDIQQIAGDFSRAVSSYEQQTNDTSSESRKEPVDA